MAFPSFEVLSPKTVDWSIVHSETDATKGAYDAAFKLTTANTVAITSGRLCGMSINVEPLTAVSCLKAVGAEICTYIDAAAIAPNVHGLFVETQGGTGITGDYYSLYVYMAPGAIPTGDSAVIRVEHNAAAARCKQGFLMLVGDAVYALSLWPNAACTAWALTGSLTTQSGWMKVNVAGTTRYLPLYSA